MHGGNRPDRNIARLSHVCYPVRHPVEHSLISDREPLIVRAAFFFREQTFFPETPQSFFQRPGEEEEPWTKYTMEYPAARLIGNEGRSFLGHKHKWI
jgi:hypothetical protein